MKQTLDSVWQRRGTSWLWNEEARNQVCEADQVWSLRQLLRTVGRWPDDLPSNDSNTVVVAGLEASLDLLTPEAAEAWLGDIVKEAVLSFQVHYQAEAALVFWLPAGQNRIKLNPANDAIEWRCAAPYSERVLAFGRILWGDASPHQILLRVNDRPAGLFHQRIA